MTEYRPFHNTDPPQLLKLWHDCRLGRGAAEGFRCDAFETLLFAQPFFDRRGLIVACDGADIVGYVHAGFGATADGSRLSLDTGVICIIMVHPDYRRQGIGRELIARAVSYLEGNGSTSITAGAEKDRDPFYIGLYGGCRVSGFLESDENAAPFLESLGYQPVRRYAVMQRAIDQQNDPVNFRLVTIRRKMELAIASSLEKNTWWWDTRFGRLDSIRFMLHPKAGGSPVASLTVHGLDLYLAKWQRRAIGLTDLFVPEAERGKGYAQALLVEVCRRLREELVTAVESHVLESDEAGIAALKSAGLERVDTGIVYQLGGEPAARSLDSTIILDAPDDPPPDDTDDSVVHFEPWK